MGGGGAAAPVESLQGLLHAQVLAAGEEPVESFAGRQAVLYAAESIAMLPEILRTQSTTVKLRLALLLAPRDAVTHRVSDRTSRFEKVHRFIASEYAYSDEVTTLLAQAVTEALDAWGTRRVSVTQYREELARRDGDRCAVCGATFGAPESNSSVTTADLYKPTALDPATWLAPTVDHIVPVSTFGRNVLSNLELLCNFCNSGKENATGPLSKHEYEYGATLPRTNIAEYAGPASGASYLRKVCYMAFERAGRTCTASGCSAQAELTIRPLRPAGLLVLGNVRVLCYACTGAVSP